MSFFKRIYPSAHYTDPWGMVSLMLYKSVAS